MAGADTRRVVGVAGDRHAVDDIEHAVRALERRLQHIGCADVGPWLAVTRSGCTAQCPP